MKNHAKLRAVHKGRPHSDEKGFIQCGHFAARGDEDVCTFWCKT